MKTILLTRHAATEEPDSSLYTVFSQIEQILEKEYRLLKAEGEPFSVREMESWTLENAVDVDLAITSYSKHIEFLKENGWRGKTIFQALGGFPRGANKFRDIMPYLYQSDAIWFTSTADRDIYYEFIDLDKPTPEAVYLPFGVNLETYFPLKSGEAREKLRKDWGVKPDDFVLVYTGRVTIEKNLHTTLRAVAELIHSGTPVKLVVVGRFEDVPFSEFRMHPMDLEDKVQALIASLQISEDVIILGWQSSEELNEVFNASDAFINLTLHHDENFGLSQIEAMSAGVPVIGTAWGGLKDTIRDLEGGFSINTWVTTNGIRIDTPAVIRAIRALIENRHLREEQGQRGRERVKAKFSYARYTEQVIQFVERVLNSPTNETRPTLSPFGTRFHQRFTKKRPRLQYAKTGTTASPVYKGLADADYRQLIAPYTSQIELRLEPESLLFLALSGRQTGAFFVSDDLLYTIRIPICSEEAEVINQLSLWHPVPRNTLKHSDTLLIELMQKGIVGVTSVSSKG